MKTTIIPEFSASISLSSSGECAWADVAHHVTRFPGDGSEEPRSH